MTTGQNPVPGYRVGPPPLPPSEEMLVVGLGSGSSGDGIDAALVSIKGSCETAKIDLKQFFCLEFDEETHHHLQQLFDFETATLEKLSLAHAIMGELFGEAALRVCQEAGTPLEEVAGVGLWGQMAHHLPTRTRPFQWRGRDVGSVFRVGDLNRIALRTGLPAVGDFPNADIAAGGNGAPLLMAVFDYAMYHDANLNRVAQNIGGIANGSLLRKGADVGSVISFDTGPGNMVIDGLVRHYTNEAENFDRDGERAARGKVHRALLHHMLQDEFIQRTPPKAAGWENYGAHFVRGVVQFAEREQLQPDDVVATATALTAESIALNYERHFYPSCEGPLDEVIVGGGGALNPTLLKMLAERVGCKVTTHDDHGNSAFAYEALCIAFSASEILRGHPVHLAGGAGASSPTFAGVIAPGYRPFRGT